MVISDKEIVVLGFNAAGWSALEADEKSKKKVTFGFGNTPTKEEDSHYYQHVKDKQIKGSKTEFLKGVAASELLANFEKDLVLSDKRRLIHAYNFMDSALWIDSPLGSIKEGMSLREVLENSRVTPYEFIFTLTTLSKSPDLLVNSGQEKQDVKRNIKTLDDIITNVDKNFPHSKERFDEIKMNDYSGLQTTIWSSKRIIADTLQENVRRFHAREPLIPMVLSMESEKNNFQPDKDGMKLKSDAFITPTEIRMIYKLMVEAPDNNIRQIMKETTSFLRQKKDGSFEKINAPWESNSWKDRPRGERGGHKKEYSERAEGAPKWMQDIVNNKGLGGGRDDQSDFEQTRSIVAKK